MIEKNHLYQDLQRELEKEKTKFTIIMMELYIEDYSVFNLEMGLHDLTSEVVKNFVNNSKDLDSDYYEELMSDESIYEMIQVFIKDTIKQFYALYSKVLLEKCSNINYVADDLLQSTIGFLMGDSADYECLKSVC